MAISTASTLLTPFSKALEAIFTASKPNDQVAIAAAILLDTPAVVHSTMSTCSHACCSQHPPCTFLLNKFNSKCLIQSEVYIIIIMN